MDIAVISPVDGPAGANLTRSLLRLGFRVYALSSCPDTLSLEDRQLRILPIVPGRLDTYQEAARKILDAEKRIDLLLLQPATPHHRRLEGAPLREVCATALEGAVVPIALVRLFLNSLLDARGYLVCVLPAVRLAEPGTNYFNACTAGLKQLAGELFEVHRRQGLRCSRIEVEVDETTGSPETGVAADHLTEGVEGLLRHHRGSVTTDLYLRVQGDAFGSAVDPSPDGFETTLLPTPENFPAEAEPIPTRKALDPLELHREAGTLPRGDGSEDGRGPSSRKKPSRRRTGKRQGKRDQGAAGEGSSKGTVGGAKPTESNPARPPASVKTTRKRTSGSRRRKRPSEDDAKG